MIGKQQWLMKKNKMKNDLTQTAEFILYTSPSGDVRLDVFIKDETLWLSQKMMAKLFGVETHTINYHLKEIFKSVELSENSVIRKIRATAPDGKKYLTKFYNLDAIIAVGYRVNSKRATQFRIWATQVLREYIIKGFILNDDRLKQGEQVFGQDYFRELLERVRSIERVKDEFINKSQIFLQSVVLITIPNLKQQEISLLQCKTNFITQSPLGLPLN